MHVFLVVSNCFGSAMFGKNQVDNQQNLPLLFFGSGERGEICCKSDCRMDR